MKLLTQEYPDIINDIIHIRPIFGKNLDIFSLADIQILCLENDFVSCYARNLGDYDIAESAASALETNMLRPSRAIVTTRNSLDLTARASTIRGIYTR
ncbi:uncharacterized protein ARMOST_18178 [Armillaria ostoyae]|uniref:Uncharacterized protein n=1 Tax=Armillaria ostoyae TaxID=47428 RepID=A0A284S128_ARMOS|nr:uncharacterized protein ARMOST_18178 [Armillaria ostoyae]